MSQLRKVKNNYRFLVQVSKEPRQGPWAAFDPANGSPGMSISVFGVTGWPGANRCSTSWNRTRFSARHDGRPPITEGSRIGIHPAYEETTVVCGCGNTFRRGTKREVVLWLVFLVSPFCTGKRGDLTAAGCRFEAVRQAQGRS